MQKILYPIYIAYLILIISLVFFDRKKPMVRFSWILALIFIPGIGLLLYLFIGSDRFLDYRKEKIRRRRGAILVELEQVANNNCGPKPVSSKAQLFHQNYCGSILTTDNEVELYTKGKDKYERLFQDLQEAKDHIHIQYFAFERDFIGKKLINILIEKVNQGVEVKLMYDSIGCLLTFIYPLLHKLKKAGGQVSTIRPHALDVNYRNHRKIVVIDGKVGYTGGMNIGSKYQDGVRNLVWRDTHIRIVGSAVKYLQQVFLFDWITSIKKPDIGLRYELCHYFPKIFATGKTDVQVVANGLYDKYKQQDIIKLSYFNLMSRANKRVWIQTPYFAPSSLIMQTLKTLAALGVDVRIMTSSSYAFGGFFHRSIGNYFLRHLMECSDVKVYKYNGIMHAKTMLVDDQGLCIGSVNLNTRSLERDDELYVYSESKELIEQYEKVFLKDFKNSTELDYVKFKKPPILVRAVESAMSFFSPLS